MRREKGERIIWSSPETEGTNGTGSTLKARYAEKEQLCLNLVVVSQPPTRTRSARLDAQQVKSLPVEICEFPEQGHP